MSEFLQLQDPQPGETTPLSPEIENRNFLQTMASGVANLYRNSRQALAIGTSVMSIGAPALAGEAFGNTASSSNEVKLVVPDIATAATSKPPHSLRYLKRNCPIEVLVNAFVPGANHEKSNGVSVNAKKINGNTANNVSPYPIVRYTWQLSKNDQFCGIVGVWPNPSGPRSVSLRPTTQTSHSGEYTDTSLHSSNGLHLTEFYVYAKSSH
ncbi:MAG TPA: hypothetical protein VLF79_00970 [Candidatus Saccharimonadales bacterium]|nr:hypothetical protein [Candidatus Saccharimonadales bacterium]